MFAVLIDDPDVAGIAIDELRRGRCGDHLDQVRPLTEDDRKTVRVAARKYVERFG